MSFLTRIKEKLEAWAGAAAFAEAHDHETALAMVGADPGKQKSLSWDDITCALAFAEAGLPDIARQYLGADGQKDGKRVLDLPGVRVWCGRVSVGPIPALAGVRVWCGTATA